MAPFDSISEERDSKSIQNLKNGLNPNSCEYVEVEREAKCAADNENYEINWEIISTTSIMEIEIECEIDKDGYQLINDYIK